MARLIDADALLDEFLKRYTKRERCGNLVFAACEIKQDFADMIGNFPTVDAVEVVRCKDCKWLYDEMDDYCCRSHRGLVRICENSFCSYGERKEDK